MLESVATSYMKWWGSNTRHKTANFWPCVTLTIATPKLEVGWAKFTASVVQWLKNTYTWLQAY